jgi:hypothetical protein
MNPKFVFILLTLLPTASSSPLEAMEANLNSQRMWSVLTNSFQRDPIYEIRFWPTAEMFGERLIPKLNMVGVIQLGWLRVVLPADFDYIPN